MTARVVATLEDTVAARRTGRVLRVVRAVGDPVAPGDPLIEFVDLPLLASRAEMEAEIGDLRERVASARSASGGSQRVRESGRALRLEALRNLEQSHAAAVSEFERWQVLHEEGLVARTEFEAKAAEFAEFERRLDEARAAAQREEPEPSYEAESPESRQLARSERLLERLNRLSETFLVGSPWTGVVRAIHAGEGAIPERGAPLVTITRAALRRLEADVGTEPAVVSVRRACGVPGPFAFSRRDGVLEMATPPSGARLGGECELVLVARGGAGN